MNIAIYIRYTEGCERLGLEEQRTACYKYAAEQGHTIVGEYIDCFADPVANTPYSFEQMMHDSRSHQFQAVLVYCLDRISQDMYKLITCETELKNHGVTVLSASESCHATPSTMLMETLLAACFDYVRAEHSEKIKRGMRLARERRAAEKALQSANESTNRK